LNHLAVAHRYFDGWNTHDAEVIAATFAPGGTYTDPTVADLDGEATGAYALSLVAAFPDLRFDLASVALTDDGSVAAQWVMRGTNTASFMGLPATGREMSLPGAASSRSPRRGSRPSPATSTAASSRATSAWT
jgi:predicted ester cyclase